MLGTPLPQKSNRQQHVEFSGATVQQRAGITEGQGSQPKAVESGGQGVARALYARNGARTCQHGQAGCTCVHRLTLGVGWVRVGAAGSVGKLGLGAKPVVAVVSLRRAVGRSLKVP